MPELPEAERARQQIERVLGREIVAVDDTRHLRHAARTRPARSRTRWSAGGFTLAHRRGKFLWVETDGGPELGLHLGMAGRIDVDERAGAEPLGPLRRSSSPAAAGWRCATSGGSAGPCIQPDFSHIGPDAAEISRDEFRTRIGPRHARR